MSKYTEQSGEVASWCCLCTVDACLEHTLVSYFICMSVCLHARPVLYLHVMSTEAKGDVDRLGLQLQKGVNHHHVGAGNRTLVL